MVVVTLWSSSHAGTTTGLLIQDLPSPAERQAARRQHSHCRATHKTPARWPTLEARMTNRPRATCKPSQPLLMPYNQATMSNTRLASVARPTPSAASSRAGVPSSQHTSTSPTLGIRSPPIAHSKVKRRSTWKAAAHWLAGASACPWAGFMPGARVCRPPVCGAPFLGGRPCPELLRREPPFADNKKGPLDVQPG